LKRRLLIGLVIFTLLVTAGVLLAAVPPPPRVPARPGFSAASVGPDSREARGSAARDRGGRSPARSSRRPPANTGSAL
jgi:hypothetical protein